jgi:hypothetical protein
LATSEVLETPNSHWRSAPSLNTARANTNAVVTAGNVIYLVGGFDNINFLSSIEVMESETLGWRYWIQKHCNKSLNEEDEESTSSKSGDDSKNSMRSDSVTPRASTATITVQ